MDLIQTLDVLADVVNSLVSLAREQAIVIEQFHLTERVNYGNMEERLAELDDKLAKIAWQHLDERR